MWSRSSFSNWIIISVDYYNAYAPSETTPGDHWETSADIPCGSLLAHLCFKWITLCCASQSLLSVHFRTQVKMVVFDLQSCEWIGLHWLNSKLFLDVVKWSWSPQILAMKEILAFFLEPASVKSGCMTEPISFSFWGELEEGTNDAYLWILPNHYRTCDLTDAGKHFTGNIISPLKVSCYERVVSSHISVTISHGAFFSTCKMFLCLWARFIPKLIKTNSWESSDCADVLHAQVLLC